MGRTTDEKDQAVTSKTASRINRFIIRHLANNLHDQIRTSGPFSLSLSRVYLAFLPVFAIVFRHTSVSPRALFWIGYLSLFFFIGSRVERRIRLSYFRLVYQRGLGSHRHGTTLIFTLAFLFSLISRVTGFLPTLSIPQMIGSTLSVQLRGIRSAPIPRHFLLSGPSLNLFPSITIHFQSDRRE